jgi:hypothetical protein
MIFNGIMFHQNVLYFLLKFKVMLYTVIQPGHLPTIYNIKRWSREVAVNCDVLLQRASGRTPKPHRLVL